LNFLTVKKKNFHREFAINILMKNAEFMVIRLHSLHFTLNFMVANSQTLGL